jgi:hypothetical protein
LVQQRIALVMTATGSCIAFFLQVVLVLLSVGCSDAAKIAPQLVYGAYLGDRDEDCASRIAVDKSGAAYVVGSQGQAE